MREGRLHNWCAYIFNFITYGFFVGAVVSYEFNQGGLAVALLIVAVILSLYDIVQDVREAHNFSFGVKFFDNCKETKKLE